MGTSLTVIERELTARKPTFTQLLPASVTPDRLLRTVVMSCERNPRLLECTPQSIMNAATTAAVLGLECDGVTGQGFIVPYKGVATFQVGYKGYNTLAARAGYTISGGIVREGDEFDYQLGTKAYITHKPKMGNQGRIVCAWAVAESRSRPAIVRVMSIEEIEAIRARSMGAKKPDSPWNDPRVGYPAMAEKTVKRRLARDMPMSVMQQAAAIDVEEPAYLDEHGMVHREEGPAAAGVIIDVQPENLTESVGWPEHKTPKEFSAWSFKFLETATPEKAKDWYVHYQPTLRAMNEHAVEAVRDICGDLLRDYAKAMGVTAPR